MSWWKRWFGGRETDAAELVEREIDDELRFHVEMRAADNERAGMDSSEAREAARRQFGDLGRIARASRHERLAAVAAATRTDRARRPPLAGFVDGLRQDVVFALRAFGRTPGLLVAAVLTLALGLGATTTIYGVANWLLLRPVPGVEDPEELRHIWVGTWGRERTSFRPWMLSHDNYRDVVARLTTLSGLAGYQRPTLSVAVPGGTAQRLSSQVVTPSFFEVLGVAPRHGRLFSADEHELGSGASPVVISERLWGSLFQRDPAVLGRELRLNGLPFTVVGVLPELFHGVERLDEHDLWLPGSAYARIRHYSDPSFFQGRDRGFFYALVGRLAPGATWEQVEAELASLGSWLADQFPDINEQFDEDTGFHVMGPIGKPAMESGQAATTLALLMGISGLVLLIACANVANLLVIKGLGRQGEMAVRKALGAGRARLLRQHLTEGLVLWLAGGLVGLVVAYWLTQLFEGATVGFARLGEVRFDAGVVVFAAALAAAVGLVFSVLPALSTLRVDAAGSLKEGAPTGTHRKLGVRTMLTVLQLSASLTLLVGALLLVRSLLTLTAVDLGFDPTGVTAIYVSPDDLGYTQEQIHGYFREFERRLRARPEVTAAAVAYRAPLRCCGYSTALRHPTDPSDEARLGPDANILSSPGLFETLGIPVLRGRVFTEDDLAPPGVESRPVVLLSASLARQLFGELDVVGRTIEYATRARAGKPYEVIGVVGDARYDDLEDEPEPMVYEPSGLDSLPGRVILVRAATTFDINSVAREIAASLDSDLPIDSVESMTDAARASMAERTLLAKLVGLLAALAGLLAAVGLYGVVAFTVDARRRELGIRMALGAGPRKVFRLVLHGTAGVTFAGLVLGLAGAIALVRFLGSRLYGVGPFDPLVWALAAGALVTIAFVAALLPARRATRVDPVQTLRAL